MNHARYEKALAPFLTSDADRGAVAIALDAALAPFEQAVEDRARGFYGKDESEWEKLNAADREQARDAWHAARRAKDSEVDHREDQDDAHDSAVELAVKRTNDLHMAREAVKSIVGVVAMDSAEGVYRFALRHCGVTNADKLHPDALAPLIDVIKSRSRPLAHDGARRHFVSVDSIWSSHE